MRSFPFFVDLRLSLCSVRDSLVSNYLEAYVAFETRWSRTTWSLSLWFLTMEFFYRTFFFNRTKSTLQNSERLPLYLYIGGSVRSLVIDRANPCKNWKKSILTPFLKTFANVFFTVRSGCAPMSTILQNFLASWKSSVFVRTFFWISFAFGKNVRYVNIG